jgi:hypothetical protein
VLTDAAGRFLLEDVEATDRHGQSSITSVVARAHGFDVAQGERFAAPPGRTVDVGAIVLERGSEVEGIVLDPEGRPAAGSRVCAWEPPAIHRGVIRAAFAVTGPDGRFRVSGLPPPHDRWERTLVVRAEPRGDDEAATSVSVTTSVAAPVASVDLRLPRGILVRGTVVDADGASVFLRSGSWFSWTTSARNGAFEFRNVPFGKATLRVRSGDLGADHDVDVPLSAPLRLVLHGDPEDSTELDDIWWGRDDTPAPPEDSAW